MSLLALKETQSASYLASTRIGALASSSLNVFSTKVPLGASAVNATRALLNWSLSKTVTEEKIKSLDSRIVSLARKDPVELSFVVFDYCLDTVLPDYEAPANNNANDNANDNNNNNNNENAVPIVTETKKEADTKKKPETVLQKSAVRVSRLQKRLMQRLEAVLAYLNKTKMGSSLNSIPTRAQTTERLQLLLRNALDTASQLRRSLSAQNQQLADRITTQLSQLEKDIRSNELSLSLIRRVSIAVLNAHELLLAARASLAENENIRKIADNSTVRRATQSIGESEWVARAQALVVAADKALVEACRDAAKPQKETPAEPRFEGESVAGSLDDEDDEGVEEGEIRSP